MNPADRHTMGSLRDQGTCFLLVESKRVGGRAPESDDNAESGSKLLSDPGSMGASLIGKLESLIL